MYIALHNRTAYSFGLALTRPEQLAAFATGQGMPAIALTDLHGLYAAVMFQQACRKVGVKPIFGTEMVVSTGQVTLLAMDARGYGNLCRLISKHHLRDQPLGVEQIGAHAEGLICLLGGEHTLSLAPNSAEGIRLLREAYAGRLYVELNIHGAEDVPVARRRAQGADESGIPVVAGGASRCVRAEQMPALRALASIGTLTLLDQPHPEKPVGHWHLRTPAEMHRLFHRRPDALSNTLKIAEQCNVTLDLDRNRFPAFASPDGRAAIVHLRELCIAGCRRRYVEQPPLRGLGGKRPTLTEALQRLDRELSVIAEVGYAEYFLVFHEIVQYCRRAGIAPLARGSAADSLVCYALGVSSACPFRFNLPFDRFINPERAKFSKMADIDLDLPWDQRDQVIAWVYDRWGHDRVAMIGAPNTFQARAAVADLGRVFGLPPHEIHEVTRRMHQDWTRHLADSMKASAQTRDLPLDQEPYPTILRMAGALEGLPRHWSMHPCGLVVAPEPLTDLVPVQPSPKGPLVAQYDMDAIEDLGFIKIDLLGQAGLSVLRDTVNEVERAEGRRIDLEREVDYADPRIWEMIATGGARGVHHIESPAMTSLIGQCHCRDIDCLTAIVALIRPGAANQGRKDTFARRHHGFEPPAFAHPSLEKVLEETYGLMVFEEHILQVAVEFAGMNLGRADVLRRALNKQKHDLIDELKKEFYAAARQGGRHTREIDAVWTLVERFSGFMFNKAHSAQYALEAVQGAWLKYHWPAHFLAAILSNYRGFYAHSPTLPQILYVLEARRLGIGLLPPCVNLSGEHFRVEYVTAGGDISGNDYRRPMIRVPVAHIKGLSQAFLGRYHREHVRGMFTSPVDFLRRCRPAPAESLLLLDSGALDGFGFNRPEIFWQLRKLGPTFAEQPTSLWRTHETREPMIPPVELTLPDAYRIARREMDLLGFPITIDPLTFLSRDESGRAIDESGYVPVSRLGEHVGRRVRVRGLMVADRMNATAGGELMKFVTLADRTGFVEVILFPDAYRRFGHLTVAHPVLAVGGVVEPFANGNGCTLRGQWIFVPEKKERAACTNKPPVKVGHL